MSDYLIMDDLQYFWQLSDFSPTPNQKDAILHTEGPLFLTAGPGSGKTRVLLWRTVNLIVFESVPPEEIFLSTFTEKAAHQLRDGLRSLLGLITNETGKPYDISKMAIGTVHAICQKILRDRRFSAGALRQSPVVVMDELSQYFRTYNRRSWADLFSEGGFADGETAQRDINNYLSGRNSLSKHYAVENCLALFNRFSEESLRPDGVVSGDETLSSLLKMYAFYLDSLDRNDAIRRVDFALLQQAAYERIMALPESAFVFKHIIIDEYQDTNAIQEKIFFAVAEGHGNICVVGDDDQALYRFRGATVENLVDFEDRCENYIGARPRRIDLSRNFRSRKRIVDFYVDFIDQIDWRKEDGKPGHYRVVGKQIHPNSKDALPSVVTSEHAKADLVYDEIAQFVRQLKLEGKIHDYNQVAFLFPTLKSTRVERFMDAFETLDIPVYAPRAGRFLEVPEAVDMFGLFLKILGRPKFDFSASRGLREFGRWLKNCASSADDLCNDEQLLTEYVQDRRKEIEAILNDYRILLKVVERKKWDLKSAFGVEMVRPLSEASGLSQKARRNLTNRFFMNIIKKRIEEGNAFQLGYIINRATSVDWSVLDLFYQLSGFKHFREMYELAESGEDEGPICNLGLITQYLARFTEEYTIIITASFLSDDKFINTFFSSYLYALFRRGESEYEDADDPFPKGRVPFLTIHQAKGLEFPVVVLGSVYKQAKGPSTIEVIVRDLLAKEGEPLDRISQFDNMRMFYVALSRAQNLLILPRYTHGKAASEPFKAIFAEGKLPKIADFDISSVPESMVDEEELGKSYSYTADYLNYQKCPRNYMIYRKYGFVPSRSQTMFFGSLVHQTIEDLHHLLIQARSKGDLPISDEMREEGWLV